MSGPIQNKTRVATPNSFDSSQIDQAYRLTWRHADQLCEISSAEISGPLCRIGKHPSNDVAIEDPTISGCHAELEITVLGCQLRDLSSTNGTWIQGLRINDVLLMESTEIRIGPITISFEPLSAAPAATQKKYAILKAKVPPSHDSSITKFHGIIGGSTQSQQLFNILEKVAAKDVTVLIEGESGTGKEGVAEAIHQASKRATKPFVVLDCAAIPESLIESELFGHERGAFTGATSRYDGHFRQANGGTLFLDELGELPITMQPKLLRVLESRQVRPVGGTKRAPVDVRVITATNRNLGQAVNEGTFREDLYYRLSVVSVRLSPLRDRIDDINLLVPHFIRQLLPDDPNRAKSIISQISDRAWTRLKALPWRGNVRELKNFIERTMVFSDDRLATALIPSADDVGIPTGDIDSNTTQGINLSTPFSTEKRRHVEAFERRYLLSQLAKHDHNFAASARASGLDRMNFKRLAKKYI